MPLPKFRFDLSQSALNGRLGTIADESVAFTGERYKVDVVE